MLLACSGDCLLLLLGDIILLMTLGQIDSSVSSFDPSCPSLCLSLCEMMRFWTSSYVIGRMDRWRQSMWWAVGVVEFCIRRL